MPTRRDRPAAASGTPASDSTRTGERIAKLLARAGVASRREVERMIAEGRVARNGTPIDTANTVLPSLAGVTVDGHSIGAPAPAQLFLYHKPTGLLVAERDPAGRPTIYDRLPAELPRVVPVGRLDLNTEGLLLLTTDGGLKRQLELPATGVPRTYRARAHGPVTQAQLEELIDGVEIEGMRYGSIDANLERRTGTNVWIELTLTEGKNREVRRVLEHLGLQVGRLIRTRYGPFVLGDLPPGEVGEVRQHDLVAFRQSLAGKRAAPAEDIVPTPLRPARAAAGSVERASPRPARAGTGAPRRSGADRTAADPRSGPPSTPDRPAASAPANRQPRGPGREGATDSGTRRAYSRPGEGRTTTGRDDRPAHSPAPRAGGTGTARDRGDDAGRAGRLRLGEAGRPKRKEGSERGSSPRAAPSRFGDAGRAKRNEAGERGAFPRGGRPNATARRDGAPARPHDDATARKPSFRPDRPGTASARDKASRPSDRPTGTTRRDAPSRPSSARPGTPRPPRPPKPRGR